MNYALWSAVLFLFASGFGLFALLTALAVGMSRKTIAFDAALLLLCCGGFVFMVGIEAGRWGWPL